MACNCIKETEIDILERLSKVNKDFKDKKITRAEFENSCFDFMNEGREQLYSVIGIEYDYKNKKGEMKHKKESINLSYRYCPICGEKYEEDRQ